jgi:RNA polymerase sigma factor (sigma-70 family)
MSVNRLHMDNTVEARQVLELLLEEQSVFFLGVISSYVMRMGLARGDAVSGLALTVWQETAIEALGHIERFARASQPRAWVLAVAANVLKRKRYEMIRQSLHELPVSGLVEDTEDRQESAFFDQIAGLAVPGPEQEVEEREQVCEMLALVSAEDQQILRLALLYDMNGQMLAHALNVPSSTARSRLHRALARLRVAWMRHEQYKEEI